MNYARSFSADLAFVALCEKYTADPSLLLGFKLANGLLLYNGRLWLSPTSHFKSLLLDWQDLEVTCPKLGAS
jgi:hypothetical protein